MAVAFLCVFGCSIGWPVTFNAFLLVLYWSTNDFLFCFTIIYWPPWTWALTNVHIKPHSCIPPDNYQHIQRISCESYQNLFWKIFEGGNRISDIFCKNGYDRKTLQEMINSFEKKTRSTNNNNNNTNKKQTITFPWIPKIGPKIKKEMQ